MTTETGPASAAGGARGLAGRAQGRRPVARLCRPRDPAPRPARRDVRGSTRASRTASSANRAAASPRQPTPRFATCPRNARHHRWPHPRGGRRHHQDERRRGSPVPDPSRLDGLSGSGRGAEPDDQDRPAGRRGVHDPRPGPEASAGKRAQGPPAGPDRRSGGGRSALSLPALRRDAAARRHRDRAGLEPEAAGPRRAHDRARRHGRGERPRPGPEPTGGDQRGGPADRPQPRRHPHAVRPGRRHVRGQDRRGGRGVRGLRQPAAPVHAGPAAVAARGTASASPSGRSSTIPGNLPQIGTDLPTCVFVDRCPLADELCRTVVPPIVDVGGGQWTRCHHRDRLAEIVEPPSIVGADTVHGERALARRPRLQDLPPERPRRAGPGRGRPRAVRRRDARAGR